jgi:hypothetical protein
MCLTIQGMLQAVAGQRCVVAMLRLAAQWLPGTPEIPCANTGRMWLLRLGLYAMTRDKPRAEDWVFIFDHTVQLGTTKVLLIVGVRLSVWESRGRGPLRHEDLSLLDVTPMEHSSGELVQERLEAVAQKTGVPRELLSDGGTDLCKAISQFQQEHPGVARGYDIKHKTALLLQSQLEKDPRWPKFVGEVNRARAQLTLTALACLLPPSLKPKARYMNLGSLIRWGRQTLAFVDDPHDFPGSTIDREKLEHKLGWLAGYREALYHWSVLLAIAAVGEDAVRQNGYHANAAAELQERLSGLEINAAAQVMTSALVEFVAGQSTQANEGENLIGSSEVLESLIGRYKRLQGTHSQGGVTPLLLGVGAMVMNLTTQTIATALAAIRTCDVLQWCQEHLGITLTAQRRYAYQEQNRETKPRPVLDTF